MGETLRFPKWAQKKSYMYLACTPLLEIQDGDSRSPKLVNCKGMIYQHYCPSGSRVNNNYYILVLDQLHIHIKRKSGTGRLLDTPSGQCMSAHGSLSAWIPGGTLYLNHGPSTVQPQFVTMWLLLFPTLRCGLHGRHFANDAKMNKDIDNSVEWNLRKGILNYNARKIVGEDGEMPCTSWTLFWERTRCRTRQS